MTKVARCLCKFCFQLSCYVLSISSWSSTACKATKRCLRSYSLYNNTAKGQMKCTRMNQDLVIKHFKALFKTECSPLSRILDSFTLFPLCSLIEVVLLCCDVSFSFYAACHLVYFLHCQEWPTFLKGTIIHRQRHIFETCHHYVALCFALHSGLPLHLSLNHLLHFIVSLHWFCFFFHD